MYEINWHHVDDKFSHCTITPITLLADNGKVIVAMDINGYKFQGTKKNYFNTKKQAEEQIKQYIKQAIDQAEIDIAKAKADLEHLKQYISSLEKLAVDLKL